jgi:hypothetical protein
MPSFLSLTRVVRVFHDKTLPSRDELLRIFIGVVRNEFPVGINQVVPWGRIQGWERSVVL